MDHVLRDIRCAIRRLARSPGFTTTALATLAICIAANVTIFAVVDAILVRALPFPEADRLVAVVNGYPGAGVDRAGASIPNYYDRRTAVKAFASVSIVQDSSSIVGSEGKPSRVETARVSPEFFRTLGVPLARGRGFTDDELLYGKDNVAILTDAYWRTHFNADPNVLGQTFFNDGLPVTIVGVLPPGFHYLSSRAQFFRPSSHSHEDREPKNRHSNNWSMVARLAPGVSIAEAQAQINAFNLQQLASDPFPDLIKGAGYHTTVFSLHADHVRNVRSMLILLQAGVLFLLLIGSVNLINLLLIRATGRTKELAVRQALGAGRWHIALEVLTETLVLALGGTVLGLALGGIGIGLLRLLGTDKLPLGAAVALDARVVVAALLAAGFVAVLLATPLTWFNLRAKLAPVLQAESRGGTTSRSTQRMRQIFIVAQVALAFVLLSGAGLLGLSLKRVLATSPGFNPDHLLAGNVALPWKHYKDDEARLAFVERLLPALRALPGVTHVAITTGLPFGHNVNDSVVTVEGFVAKPGETVRAHYLSGATSDYWPMMNIPLLRGRLLEDADNHRKPRVCVVDQAFAARYWPGRDPIGRQLASDVSITPENATTVVGVVGNVKQTELAEREGHGAVYFPYGNFSGPDFALIVRATVPPAALAPMIQRAILQLDPDLPIDDLRPMQARIDDSLIARRSPAILAGIFAGVALLLAAIGTYGVLSYSVTQRHREIGVRMALGALGSDIRNQFFALGLRVMAVGTVAGVAGAWAAGRAMQSILFEVPPMSGLSVTLTVVLIGGVTLAACLLPALRAAKVDPVVALRSD